MRHGFLTSMPAFLQTELQSNFGSFLKSKFSLLRIIIPFSNMGMERVISSWPDGLLLGPYLVHGRCVPRRPFCLPILQTIREANSNDDFFFHTWFCFHVIRILLFLFLKHCHKSCLFLSKPNQISKWEGQPDPRTQLCWLFNFRCITSALVLRKGCFFFHWHPSF